jgi:hypothetical protein
MTEPALPTLQDIEAITSYLPRLYADGFSPVVRWEGGENLKDGSFTLPYPEYHPLVEEFFRLGRGAWIDYEYDPEQAYSMLTDEGFIRTASLSQVRTMLTFCVRGERFSDGHWAEMIEKGYVRRILERLNEIKSEMRKE